jgi:hypothetical protein
MSGSATSVRDPFHLTPYQWASVMKNAKKKVKILCDAEIGVKNMFPIKDINELESAFPITVEGFMPDYKDIPQQFKHGRTKWNKIMNEMFFMGGKVTKMIPKEE